MRHLGSIVLSLIVGPIVYVLIAFGLASTAQGVSSRDQFMIVAGLGAVIGAGLLYALLVLTRLSPLGTLLLGLGYLAAATWMAIRPESLDRITVADRFGIPDADDTTPVTVAVAAMLAVPLVLTVFSARRWRRQAEQRVVEPVYPQQFTTWSPMADNSDDDTRPLPTSGPPAVQPGPPAWPVSPIDSDRETTRRLST